MKRITLILTLMLSLIVATGCKQEKINKLRMNVEDANRQCPVSLGIDGEISSFTYNEDDNCVDITMTITDEMEAKMYDNADTDKLKKSLGASMSDATEMLQEIIDAGASMRFIITSPYNQDNLTVELSADELQKILDNPPSPQEKSQAAIQSSLHAQKAACPMAIEDGMTMTDCAIIDNNYTYVYEFDETLYDFSVLEADKDDLKRELLRGMRGEATSEAFINHLTTVGMGICYRYVGNQTHNTLDIIFSTDELLDEF